MQDHVFNEYCQYLLDLDGNRGDGAHGQWGTWAIGPMGDGTFWPITSLLLDGFLQTFSHIQLKPPQPAQGYFYGSWIRTCTGSFGDVPKYFGLLKEVGHIAKWEVFTEVTLFGSNFFSSVIRAHTGSFANVCAGTSPLYIKVVQILGLSKNGLWALVDAHRFFFPNILLFDLFYPEKVKKKCVQSIWHPKYKSGSNVWCLEK